MSDDQPVGYIEKPVFNAVPDTSDSTLVDDTTALVDDPEALVGGPTTAVERLSGTIEDDTPQSLLKIYR